MKRSTVIVCSFSLLLSNIALAQPSGPAGRVPAAISKSGGSRLSHDYYQPGFSHHWHKGDRLYHWNHYRHFQWQSKQFLHAPAPGYYWVRADGRYLLVEGATGIVVNVNLGD